MSSTTATKKSPWHLHSVVYSESRSNFASSKTLYAKTLIHFLSPKHNKHSLTYVGTSTVVI